MRMTKQHQQSNIDNVGNDGYGGDGNGDGNSDGDCNGNGDDNGDSNGDGNGNDAATAANGNNVDDNGGGIQGQR
jgi:hypothetical protein